MGSQTDANIVHPVGRAEAMFTINYNINMAIYRYSLLISGVNLDSDKCRHLLEKNPLYVYRTWYKGEKYTRGHSTHKYNENSVMIVHDSFYATIESERAKIVNDFLSFLIQNEYALKQYGATDIDISIFLYLESYTRLIIFTNQELKLLSCIKSIVVRFDMLIFGKREYKKILDDMNKNRNSYERL